MRKWLSCTYQVEDNYSSTENEPLKIPWNYVDNVPGYQRRARASAPVKAEVQKAVPPIEVPALSLSELKVATDNFGSKAFIGEGSYGRVYYANSNNGKICGCEKVGYN